MKDTTEELKNEIDKVSSTCIRCKLCQQERTFSLDGKKGGLIKRALFISLLITAIFGVRISGLDLYLDEDRLRGLVSGYGMIAPLVYILIYGIAPILLLPGLPITLTGGILFGPFWGVVYTITGATLGACLAFLVSRYAAREWIENKLRGPRWRGLDENVERHGWRVVAFTRLIPIFPFNLLNYAFGLTKVKFLHYAVATFICMLPACIAFVVFSSSLLDLLKGRISGKFITGLVLVVLVSLIPFFYRIYKEKKGKADPV